MISLSINIEGDARISLLEPKDLKRLTRHADTVKRGGFIFTSSESMAELYAEKQGKKRGRKMKYQAILKVIGHHSAKDMRPLYDAITTIQQNHGQPMKLEGEVLFMQSVRFRVLNVKRTETRTKEGMIYRDTYELEEI